MNQSKISVRYAKALFLLATEKDLIDEIKNDIDYIKLVSETVEEFRFLVESPVVETSNKREAFVLALKGSVNQITLNFIDLVTKNKREIFITDICRNFLDLVRKNNGIESASFITAADVDQSILANVKEIADDYFKTNVELSSIVDKKILGGYILRVGDKQFDASINSKLKKVKQQLMNTNFEK